MQFRLALAACAAVFTIAGGTVVNQAIQRRSAASGSYIFAPLHQFWCYSGTVRGKLVVLAPGKSLDDAGVNDRLVINGDGSGNSATVWMAPTSADNERIGAEEARLTLELGQSKEVRDKHGRVVATVHLVPLTADEDQQLRDGDAQDIRRAVEIYQNPLCISMDSARRSFGAHTRLPGLMAWTGPDVDITGRRYENLETGGYGWKVIGSARVTMTLHTDPKHPSVVSQYLPERRSGREMTDTVPELSGLIPAPSAVPKVYWSQAAPGVPQQAGFRQEGSYMLDERGCWAKVARSGEFTGYGRHVVNGADGKPELILEVAPL